MPLALTTKERRVLAALLVLFLLGLIGMIVIEDDAGTKPREVGAGFSRPDSKPFPESGP